MDALLGIAHFELAAAALDPLCDMTVIKDKAERRRLSDSNLRLRRSFDFLTSHGYVAEAGLLKRWARDCDRLSDALRKSMDATGPGSTTEFLTVSSVYVQAFRNGARLLTICGLAFLLWLVTGLFTYRKRFDGLWDRRAAMSASLIAALPLAVILELFVEGATDPARGMSTLMGNLLDAMSGDHVMSKMLGISFARVAVPLHWSLVVVMMGCGIIGLIVALRRASKQGRLISIPAAALIPAYVALFGLIAEDSYNSHLSSRDVVGAVDWRCLIAPLVLLVIYGTFRAASWSFGQARQSGPMVFLATLRYGSALVAAIFAVAYAVLLPVTVIDSRRAENMSHTLGRAEASVIHNALR
jgi:hypothetical protein